MPRITKSLPPNRADWTFGDLVYWHLFKFGTKPKIDPAAEAGDLWEMESICRALGDDEPLTERTIRNWINGRSFPDDISELCSNLFGDNTRWAPARAELQNKFELGWAKRRAAKNASAVVPPSADEDAIGQVASTAPVPAEIISHEEPEASDLDPEPIEPERIEPERDAKPIHPVIVLRPVEPYERAQPPRRKVPAIVAGAVVLLGLYAWAQSGREPEKKVATVSPKVETPVPVPPAAPPRVEVQPSPPRVDVQPPVRVEVPPPAPPVIKDGPRETSTAARDSNTKVLPPSTDDAFIPRPNPSLRPAKREDATAPVANQNLPPPPERPAPVPAPSASDIEKAERLDRAQKLLAAQDEIYRREQLEKERQAILLDASDGATNTAEVKRETDNRAVHGYGYNLTENTALTGQSMGNLLTDTAADCGLACTKQGCDGFDFYRDEYPLTAKRPRTCYLFKKPLTPYANPGHVYGEPKEKPAQSTRPSRGSLLGAPVRYAQATQSDAPASSDGIVRCPSGPVKVTGFDLKCDWTVSGGTTLGSTRLSYSVSNINECAAKCRPVGGCTAFAYNSGDAEGQRACIIFGGRPEGRESRGWISGSQ